MNIGHITSTGKGYEGELRTLTMLRTITIEPNRNGGPKAPHYRVFDAPAREIGYAYLESFDSETDGRTVEYLNIKLDDPTFAYPIYCKVSQRQGAARAHLVAPEEEDHGTGITGSARFAGPSLQGARHAIQKPPPAQERHHRASQRHLLLGPHFWFALGHLGRLRSSQSTTP